MQLSAASLNPPARPMYDDGVLTILANHNDGKITDFTAKLNGKEIHVKVRNFQVLPAWQQIEEFINSNYENKIKPFKRKLKKAKYIIASNKIKTGSKRRG